MTMARTVIRQSVYSHDSPAAAVAAANDVLEAHGIGSMYVTLFIGWYDVPRGALRYVNAGHPPPLRIDAAGRVSTFGEVGGSPLGMLPGRSYDAGASALVPGDRLVLYTDGAPEARDADGEFYGDERFAALVSGLGRVDPATLCTRIAEALEQYQDGMRSDDLTLVVLERKRQSSC
jgi:sigma-B regulation protein RsbU (phosphoserine phosphatase)